MIPHTPDLVTTAEAAIILGVIPRRVRQLITAGLLPAQRFGRDWLIPRKAVEARKRERVVAA